MASFSIANGQTSTVPQLLSGGDTGTIATFGVLAPISAAPAVHFSFLGSGPGTATLTNFGQIQATNGDAVYGPSGELATGANILIDNESGADISSAFVALDFPEITAVAGAALWVLNLGSISGVLGAAMVAGLDSAEIDNYGVIDGSVSLAAVDNQLITTGTLTGAVDMSGQFASLNNSGTLTGAVSLLASGDALINSGTIDGDVAIGGDAGVTNSAVNAGTITGNLTFGAGSDRLTLLTSEKILGSIDGGAGANILALGGAGANSVGNFSHFQTVNLNSGSWTLQSETMDSLIFAGATTVSLDRSLLTDGRFAPTIYNFALGDSIVLKGSANLTSFSINGDNLLTLWGSDGSVKLQFDRFYNYGATTFALTYNGAGDAILTVVICFYPGTRIATPMGEAAVETLAAGDDIVTADGRHVKIRWMGRQTVSTRFGDPLRVLPVRICAGALGDNLPVRDLLVSPDHALLIDGVLVHAGALVNDVNIFRESDVPETFTYWHIETADHSLLLAEGVAAETFVDNVDRLAFDNWDEHAAAETPAPIAEMAYPRVKSARQLPQAIRRRLAATRGGARVRAA